MVEYCTIHFAEHHTSLFPEHNNFESDTEMTVKEDLRVRKTKKAIAEAFMALLKEKSLEDITVNELCERAGVRRTTFYKHFKDKFDYIASFVRGLRSKFDNIIWKAGKPDDTPEYYVMYAKQVISFIMRHESEIDHVMQSPLITVVLNILSEQNYYDTYERIQMSVSAGLKINASAEVLSSMLVGGVTNAIFNWLKSGKNKSPEELAEEVGAIVRRCIS